jgi:hypothetical protein
MCVQEYSAIFFALACFPIPASWARSVAMAVSYPEKSRDAVHSVRKKSATGPPACLPFIYLFCINAAQKKAQK